MSYTLEIGYRGNPARRHAFNELAAATFGLSFEDWYRAGYWSDKYEPHTLFHGDRAIANVSVNRMTLALDGVEEQYIQLGTVMVAQGYRGQGLARQLMELVIDRYASQAAGIYLIANGGVLNFYPKFGFQPQVEYQHSALLRHYGGDVRKLDLDNPADFTLLRQCYDLGNPYAAVDSRKNFELLMFYCMAFLKNCLFYSPSANTVVVARQQDETLFCFDAFGEGKGNLTQLLCAAAGTGTRRTVLGFTPSPADGFAASPIETDDHLFIRGKNPFLGRQGMLPLLSHA